MRGPTPASSRPQKLLEKERGTVGMSELEATVLGIAPVLAARGESAPASVITSSELWYGKDEECRLVGARYCYCRFDK